MPSTDAEVHALAGEYEYAGSWIRSLSDQYHVSDHNEAFFAKHVLGKLSTDLAVIGRALRTAADSEPEKIDTARMTQLYSRLAWTFRCEVSSFQRKRFASLSAEANKAMNLNSYIGLMGGAYREVNTPAGLNLVPVPEHEADLIVPESEYVLTIDADSVIMPEYCLRLVHLLEREEHQKVAVAQSPYSAFPGAATRLERIAGATTDLQHIIHQGMTYNNATFWVGANAILRKSALNDIEEIEYKGPFKIYRYISDRTVIEDTESTIDLAAGGWTLYNYNERLAFSATPPDFGSLAIQRNRWANGGLLILPKMWRAVRERRKRGERTSIGELLLRLNYMASTFWASLFVLCLMIIPFNGHLVSPLTYAVAIPYFLVMAIDLKYCGYKYFDAARIYGFNLLLLPVNLTGSISSMVQALTGAKGKFMRTPKVRNRTVPAFLYVVLPYLLVGWSVYTFKVASEHHQWSNAVFARSTPSSAPTRSSPSSASATRSSTSGSTSSPGSTSRRGRRRWRPARPRRPSRPTTASPTGNWSSTSATPTAAAAPATSPSSRATSTKPRSPCRSRPPRSTRPSSASISLRRPRRLRFGWEAARESEV